MADAVGLGFKLLTQPETPEEVWLKLWLARSGCLELELTISAEDRLRVMPFSSALMLRFLLTSATFSSTAIFSLARRCASVRSTTW